VSKFEGTLHVDLIGKTHGVCGLGQLTRARLFQLTFSSANKPVAVLEIGMWSLL